jgi:signal transduction histidine kinase/CheY-like chemotaxis protein
MENIQILVVDDEPGITQLCERLLTKVGYQVYLSNDLDGTINIVEKHRIDLLLVDIRLPEISGFELIAKVKEYQPDTAVLVMTGFGTVETAIQALRQGVDGLILKPFETRNELIATVEKVLSDNQKKHDVARIQALRPLFDITETFLTETHPNHLIELVVNGVCGLLRCENAGFYQYSAIGNKLTLLVGRGITPRDEASALDGGLIGRACALGTQFWVKAEDTDEEDVKAILVNLGLKSAFLASITRLNIYGVLYVGRNADADPFRDVDWEMFLFLTRQAAIAMENARLYEELREYVRRVEGSQQALLRAEKMAAAGRLTASIAHEINNPLQAVQNCLHLATRGEIAADKQLEYINLANHELDRLMSTVQRMLDFFRPGAVEPQNVNIALLLRRVIDLLTPQLNGRNIRISTGLSSKLPLIVAVSSQLEQVFINLILNAYDAMPNGGEIRINARSVRDMVEILFRDTGPGIAEEDHLRIFEPFVSTKEGGTGLGLAVSSGIISAHGGNLDLLPDRRPGACFRVLIPIKGEV